MAFTLNYVLYNMFVIYIARKIADVTLNRSNIILILYSLIIIILLSIFQEIECNIVIKYGINIISALFIIFYYLQRLSRVTGITVASIIKRANNIFNMVLKR